MYEIVNYVTPDGRDLYMDWYGGLRDSKAKTALERRLTRVRSGNFGDHKFVGDGVWELRVDVGAGYRIYYGRLGAAIVLLLGGGDKDTQSTDIARAAKCWAQAREERR